MAALFGKNATLINAAKKAGVGEVNGHSKTMYDEYTLLADAANLDTIDLGAKLPKGARVTSCVLKAPDLGGTGTMDVGYLANGVDAAALTGFIAAGDTSGQASQISGSGASIGKKLGAETTVRATFNGVTASATGKTVQVWVHYIVA
jgi:hypothetical protein